MVPIELKERQLQILEIIEQNQPISGQHIADKLNLSRSALRSDLSVLSMAGLIGAKPKVGYYRQSSSKSLADNALLSTWLQSVGEVKSRPIVIDESVTVYDAIVTLFLEDVGTIFVVSKGYLAGVVSRKDLLKTSLGGADLKSLPVAMIMTRMPNIVMAYSDDTLQHAALKIMEHAIDALPVVEACSDENDNIQYKVIGRISKTNIANQFVELFTKVKGGKYEKSI